MALLSQLPFLLLPQDQSPTARLLCLAVSYPFQGFRGLNYHILISYTDPSIPLRAGTQWGKTDIIPVKRLSDAFSRLPSGPLGFGEVPSLKQLR